MRGHLVQGPSLACQFGGLPGRGHIASSAHPHTGLLSCPTPGHASPFRHLYPHLQNALPLMAVPSSHSDEDKQLKSTGQAWGECRARQWVCSSAHGSSPPLALEWSHLSPPTPPHPSTTTDSTDLTAPPMRPCMGDRPTLSGRAGYLPSCPPCNRPVPFLFGAITGCRAVPQLRGNDRTLGGSDSALLYLSTSCRSRAVGS